MVMIGVAILSGCSGSGTAETTPTTAEVVEATTSTAEPASTTTTVDQAAVSAYLDSLPPPATVPSAPPLSGHGASTPSVSATTMPAPNYFEGTERTPDLPPGPYLEPGGSVTVSPPAAEIPPSAGPPVQCYDETGEIPCG
jgi:hypothetical protein